MTLRYLNLELGFHRHPKTRRLVGLLGRGAETILTRLWCHCGEHHCETGTLTGYSEQEIESIVEWWGKPGVCVEALLKLGFLSRIEGGYVVHDFLEHSGHLAYLKRRGRENAEKRWRKRAEPPPEPPPDEGGDASSNASSITSSNAPTFFPSSLPPSSSKEGGGVKEQYNPGFHAHKGPGSAGERLVSLYFQRTKSPFKSTKAAAIRYLAEMFINEPGVDVAAIEKGIEAYAKECERENYKACNPEKFFAGRMWTSYEGTDDVTVPVNHNAALDQRYG